MGTTTFSGPIKAGTIRNTTGTTLGTNVANAGSVVMSQSSDTELTHATTTATALGIIIPAKSQILSMTIIVESLFTASSTATISVGNSSGDATDVSAATQVGATATSAVMSPAAVDVWTNTGTSDVELYGITIANSASAGSARITVQYVQANNLTAN
tara:strand:+ start:108 stop:578 length:471 start_codon:yes stop_codon:yes gene_type:complete